MPENEKVAVKGSSDSPALGSPPSSRPTGKTGIENPSRPNLEFVGFRIEPRVKAKLEVLAEEQGVPLSDLLRAFVEDGMPTSRESLQRYSAGRRVREALDETSESTSDLCEQIERMEKVRQSVEQEIGQILDLSTGDDETKVRALQLAKQLKSAEEKIADLRGKLLGVAVPANLPRKLTGKKYVLTVSK